MMDITTRYKLFVRIKHAACVVPDFPIQAPICLYTTRAIVHKNVAELCEIDDIIANTLFARRNMNMLICKSIHSVRNTYVRVYT